MPKTIMISGATSAIAQAFARRHATRGAHFYLLGRNTDKLDIVKADLIARGAGKVECENIDFSGQPDYNSLVESVSSKAGQIDIILLAQGILTDEARAHSDVDYLASQFEVNALSMIKLATLFGEKLRQQGTGALLMISSPAGDRGREKNYVYGSAKAAVTVFCDGLRNRLGKQGVQVITVKPGFTRSPMTADLDQSGPLWVDPDVIARDMDKAIEKGRDKIYSPWFWRYIMLIIRHIPEVIFKKLSI